MIAEALSMNGSARHAPPPGNPPPEYSAARERIEEIEQLWIGGYDTYQIASKLCLRVRDVGRNLREIRKRHERALKRQTPAVSAAQCAAVYRQAMEGWHRSQDGKCTVTTRSQDGKPDSITTRIANSPGSCAFLNTALRARKMIAAMAEQAATGAASGAAKEAVRLALYDVLTPAQVETVCETLSPQQMEEFGAALDYFDDKLARASAGGQDTTAADYPAAASGAADIASVNEACRDECHQECQEECDADRAPVDAPSQAGNAPIEVAAEAAVYIPDVEAAPAPVSPLAAEDVSTDEDISAAEDLSANEHPAAEPRPLHRLRPAATRRGAIGRNPEWPADSVLTQGCLASDRRFEPEFGRKKAYQFTDLRQDYRIVAGAPPESSGVEWSTLPLPGGETSALALAGEEPQ